MKNLLNIPGIKAEFKPKFKLSECLQGLSYKEAFQIFKNVWDEGLMTFLEEFKVIILNNANRFLGVFDIAMGGKDFVPVDMKVIYSIALIASAYKIILAHNHPSEKLLLSSQDKAITTKAVEAGKVLYIEVCDHIIASEDGYYSLKVEGCF